MSSITAVLLQGSKGQAQGEEVLKVAQQALGVHAALEGLLLVREGLLNCCYACPHCSAVKPQPCGGAGRGKGHTCRVRCQGSQAGEAVVEMSCYPCMRQVRNKVRRKGHPTPLTHKAVQSRREVAESTRGAGSILQAQRQGNHRGEHQAQGKEKVVHGERRGEEG